MTTPSQQTLRPNRSRDLRLAPCLSTVGTSPDLASQVPLEHHDGSPTPSTSKGTRLDAPIQASTEIALHTSSQILEHQNGFPAPSTFKGARLHSPSQTPKRDDSPAASDQASAEVASRTCSQVPPHPPVPLSPQPLAGKIMSRVPLPPQPFAGMPASPCTSQRPVSSSVPRRLAFRTGTSAALLSLIAVFAVCTSPAMASRQRVFEGSFGCEKGVVGCTMPDPYPLAVEPWSVAVDDASGDVYVSDASNHRVEEFDQQRRIRADVR